MEREPQRELVRAARLRMNSSAERNPRSIEPMGIQTLRYFPPPVAVAYRTVWCLLVCMFMGEQPTTLGAETEADLFSRPQIPEIHLDLSLISLEKLRKEPRQDVTATIRSGGAQWLRVAVHIKGRVGSKRTIDDKPSLTLDFGKHLREQRFHGEEKIHLNNSVEDPSYMNESVGSHLFRSVGIPTPRVGFAIVFLNERRLGAYVLKENFSPAFLSASFSGGAQGILYEPETGHDVDEALRGKPARNLRGASTPSPLQLAAALQDTDLESRWRRASSLLDTERFIRFMAVEILIGHRDGYCMARNNFRVFYDPTTRHFTFLPHGMDVLFGTPELTWKPEMAGLAARSLLEREATRREYRYQLEDLVTQHFDVASLIRLIDTNAARLHSALNASERVSIDAAIQSLKNRIDLRKRSLLTQLATAEKPVLSFAPGPVLLQDWFLRDLPAGGAIRREVLDGRATLLIQAGPTTSASWRSRVRLAPGKYRMEAEVRTLGVRPLSFGIHHGASLRRAGTDDQNEQALVGDRPWTRLRMDFGVDTEGEVELICELRAKAGRAWFAADSLRLSRLEDAAPSPH